MKTFYRLIVSPTSLSLGQKREREKLVKMMQIPDVLEVVDTYKVIPELMEVGLEGGDNLDEDHLKEVVGQPGYHQIHAVYNLEQWHELDIRSSLRGQQDYIDGQIITYSKIFTDKDYKEQFDGLFRQLTATSVTEFHETMHGACDLFGVEDEYAFTHYFFYGYDKMYKKSEEDQAERWAKQPKPIEGWQALPWDKLEELEPNDEGLKIILKPLPDTLSWAENDPKSIVWHQTGGRTANGAYNTLKERKLSYHYLVTEIPTVVWKLVPTERSAWHAGKMKSPTVRVENFYKGNPNRESIGIAVVGKTNYADHQLDTCVALTNHLEKTLNTNFDGLNIFTHNDIDSEKPEAVTDILSYVLLEKEGVENLITKLIKQIIQAIVKKWG